MSESFSDDLAAVGRIEAVTKILEVICRTTGLGFSAVARVTESRWIACAVRDEIQFGLVPGGELVLDTTICDEIRQTGELVVIEDAESDDQFGCPPTPRRYGFRSDISVPIVLPDERFFGTLCAIDPRPAQLKRPETVEMFKLFASLIALHLETQLRLIASEKALLSEREVSQLREQFIAVLGHDLRNPLGAISSSAMFLSMASADEETRDVGKMIGRSVIRMTELIENVLDLARGRLGGGLNFDRTMDEGLESALNQVITELDSGSHGRTVRREIAIDRPALVNSARLAQTVSNLLGNALTHGDRSSPVSVRAQTSSKVLEIAVANGGKPVPPETAARLFQPFIRGTDNTGPQGLGLGLYIASEIARGHGGELSVESTSEQTCFTFRMPLAEEN